MYAACTAPSFTLCNSFWWELPFSQETVTLLGVHVRPLKPENLGIRDTP